MGSAGNNQHIVIIFKLNPKKMKKIYLLIIIGLMLIANIQLGCNDQRSYKDEYKEAVRENIDLNKEIIKLIGDKKRLESENTNLFIENVELSMNKAKLLE